MASTINATTSSGIVATADNTGSLALQTSGTTAVTIDTSQNVGIGTTSPANFGANTRGITLDGTGNFQHITWRVNGTTVGDVFTNGTSGFFIGTENSSPLQFQTAGAERMRIDTSGNLLVGGTSSVASSRLLVKGSGSSSGTTNLYVQNSSSADILYMRDDGAINTGTTTSSPYNLTTGSGANAVLGSDGFLRRSTSSLKYKTDIQDTTHGLSEVMQLRPVTYKGKEDGDKIFGGLIAEEVDAIGLKEFIEYAEDGSPDALSYGHMVSLLTKAIQEQQELIQQLQADVAALKGAK